MFSYLLRPGNADAKKGCFGLLKRVLPKLRQAFPGAVIRTLRLDSGFSGPDLYEFMEAQECEYVVAMAKNSVLKTLAEPAMAVVREDADQDIETICYDDDLYAARSWSHKRRVIIKGQITSVSFGPSAEGESPFPDHEYQQIASTYLREDLLCAW